MYLHVHYERHERRLLSRLRLLTFLPEFAPEHVVCSGEASDFYRVPGYERRVSNWLPQVHTSRFGIIPKGIRGKWWLITNMSHSEGASMNNTLQESVCSLTYVCQNWSCSSGHSSTGNRGAVGKSWCEMYISQHASAPWWLVADGNAMGGGSVTVIDAALPFGLQSAPKTFSAIADTTEWIVKAKGVDVVYITLYMYLDDCLLIEAPAS